MNGDSVFRDALLVARKDLRLEIRSRVATNRVMPFVLSVVLLFGFALDTDSGVLRRSSSGVFWVTVVFAATLLVQRSAAVEQADGIADALRLSAMSPGGIFLGKTAALVCQLLATEAVLAGAIVVVYDVDLSGPALLAAVTLMATVAVAAAGSMYGPIASGLAAGETVLPLLFLPVLAPVLLAATRAFEVALGRGVGSGWPWVGMLGMLSGIYLVLGVLTSGPLLDET